MYAEERLGRNINSAGIMWEMIEEVFQGIRTVMMSKSGRARSGSFRMMWSASLQQFWEVRVLNSINFTLTVIATVINCIEPVSARFNQRSARGKGIIALRRVV